MHIAREEIFGPRAAVIKVADFTEAVAVANDTQFGLSSAIRTGSLKIATEFQHRSKGRMVMVNLPTAGIDYQLSFCELSASSLAGCEQGCKAMDFHSVVKTANTFANGLLYCRYRKE